MSGGRPLMFKSAKELQKKIDEYFETCFEEVWLKIDGVWKPELDHRGYVKLRQIKPFTITGLAAHLQTSRQTLLNYQERDEFFDTIKNAKVKIEAYIEESLFEPKIAAGVIFNLKNNFNWVDKQDLNMTGDMDINVTLDDDDEG